LETVLLLSPCKGVVSKNNEGMWREDLSACS
jgi:hypothetical protein